MTQWQQYRKLGRRITRVENTLFRQMSKLHENANEQNYSSNGKIQKTSILTEEKGRLLLEKVKYLVFLLQEKIPSNDIIERNKRVTQILMAILEDLNSVTTFKYLLIIEGDKKMNMKKNKNRRL